VPTLWVTTDKAATLKAVTHWKNILTTLRTISVLLFPNQKGKKKQYETKSSFHFILYHLWNILCRPLKLVRYLEPYQGLLASMLAGQGLVSLRGNLYHASVGPNFLQDIHMTFVLTFDFY
jgi:hypothetical protein